VVLPKQEALDFIPLKNEKYDREFYTGFLGELNRNFKTMRMQ
jgi:isochorismate synthase